MRSRFVLALPALAATALLFVGCASGSDPSATTTPAADLCADTYSSGSASEGVTISGDYGAASTETFDLGQEVSDVQRTVVTEGEGDEIADGDYVTIALTAFDGDTGEELQAGGYGSDVALPLQVTAGSGLGQALGCATVGSRLSIVWPGTEDDPAAQFYIIDILGIVPTAAWGTAQDPVAGMPTVTLADDGQPSVEIPDADAPTDLEVSVLKQGDGDTVADGDTTLLQYYGVNWADGTSFDSSWANGAPISISGNTYVDGFVQALAGQQVGSQVLVVIPPALGYGEASDTNTNELAGQTLVFVIDILATQHATS